MLKPCPCGAVPILLNVNSDGGKWAYVSGDCCGQWEIEFRLQYAKADSDEANRRAAAAWNDAPRDAALTARAEKRVAELEAEADMNKRNWAERSRNLHDRIAELEARLAVVKEAWGRIPRTAWVELEQFLVKRDEARAIDAALSDSPALAVVEGKVVANALTDNRREIIIYRAHSNGVFLVEPIPVTVVVLHANAVLERGVDHPTLSEG